MRKNTRLVPSNQQAYADHVESDWNAVQDKERFYMTEKNYIRDVNKEDETPPPVETPATPAPRTTDLKGLASAKHVTVDGLDLDVIATHDPHSSWTYSTEGMSCGNCSALVPTDPDLVFCPHCGVGYVVRAYVGIAP